MRASSRRYGASRMAYLGKLLGIVGSFRDNR